MSKSDREPDRRGSGALGLRSNPTEDSLDLVPVMALHALAYCPRLFYLENVEGQRVANARVYAGRELHSSLEHKHEDSLHVVSSRLGLQGRVDFFRSDREELIPVEVKRGRAKRTDTGLTGWPSDVLQVGAYAMLLEESLETAVGHARIHYARDRAWVHVNVTDDLRRDVQDAVDEARRLSASSRRPPVAENENLCKHCSLSGVCLPDEERSVENRALPAPPDDDRQVVHVTDPGSRIGKSALCLRVRAVGGSVTDLPIAQVHSVVLHGNVQLTSQAIRLCVQRGVGVHWLTGSGRYLGSLAASVGNPTRRIRQYEALLDADTRLRLVLALVSARIWNQYRYLLRASRGKKQLRANVQPFLRELRTATHRLNRQSNLDSIRGIEGAAGRAYHGGLRKLIQPPDFASQRRTRQPAQDPFNALLNYSYSLLLARIANAVLACGIDPHLGFYHTDRSAAPPLTLDLMELFRVPLCDMSILGAINRRTWRLSDFDCSDLGVRLSRHVRTQVIELFERRLDATWKHPATRHSLPYRKVIELEVQLLEKEWSGSEGQFAQARLR
ncbi:MAG: type I-MYXAN CRISPR-associated endonuclease Cas1 [Gammaproteobacteria bacterium]|nr:type I-MYXAN CRISPR-associated endonuclease Cas1 [Gammaproteobacteria bacterium]